MSRVILEADPLKEQGLYQIFLVYFYFYLQAIISKYFLDKTCRNDDFIDKRDTFSSQILITYLRSF